MCQPRATAPSTTHHFSHLPVVVPLSAYGLIYGRPFSVQMLSCELWTLYSSSALGASFLCSDQRVYDCNSQFLDETGSWRPLLGQKAIVSSSIYGYAVPSSPVYSDGRGKNPGSCYRPTSLAPSQRSSPLGYFFLK